MQLWSTQYFHYRFEFMKACGSSLKVLNVATGFQWIGERVRLLSLQSDLHVRSLYPLLPKV